MSARISHARHRFPAPARTSGRAVLTAAAGAVLVAALTVGGTAPALAATPGVPTQSAITASTPPDSATVGGAFAIGSGIAPEDDRLVLAAAPEDPADVVVRWAYTLDHGPETEVAGLPGGGVDVRLPGLRPGFHTLRLTGTTADGRTGWVDWRFFAPDSFRGGDFELGSGGGPVDGQLVFGAAPENDEVVVSWTYSLDGGVPIPTPARPDGRGIEVVVPTQRPGLHSITMSGTTADGRTGWVTWWYTVDEATTGGDFSIGSGLGPEDGVLTLGAAPDGDEVVVQWSYTVDGGPATVVAGRPDGGVTVPLVGLTAGWHVVTLSGTTADGRTGWVAWQIEIEAAPTTGR
jgi:hypothetical protein